MLTFEEILSPASYCSENGITVKQRLHELNIPEYNFYFSARQSASDDTFIQL